MLAERLHLLQAYASWLADERCARGIDEESLAPILGRVRDGLPAGEVFIDARKEDALLALAALYHKTTLQWPVLFGYLERFGEWRRLNNEQEILGEILRAVVYQVPDERLCELTALLCMQMCQMADNKSSLQLVFALYSVVGEQQCDSRVVRALTVHAAELLSSPGALINSPKIWPVWSLILKSAASDCESDTIFPMAIRHAVEVNQVIRVKTDPPQPLVALFVELVKCCHELLKSSTDPDITFFKSLAVHFGLYSSAVVFGQIFAPVVDLLAAALSPQESLGLLKELLPVIDRLSKVDLTGSPEYEQPARLYGNLMGRLVLSCLDNERPGVFSSLQRIYATEASTGGSSCPTALPILGALCKTVRDAKLADHCSSIISLCLQKGPYGQRSRIFYDQMVAIAASTPGVGHLNSTLDVLCRTFLEMEGLDANSAALATAFEDLVSACSGDQVKAELVTLSLLGLFVQKGVRLAGPGVKTTAGIIMKQPPAALLELLLPAVSMGFSKLETIESISRQAHVELVQEFWFVALFHAFQPALNWPESWLRPLAAIAFHSPVLIKERDRTEGNTAKVLLSQQLSGELRSFISSLLTNCASRVEELSTAQCLWLLAVHQSESMRVVQSNRFESLVQYLTDDIVAELDLSGFVNDLSVGIVKEWIDRSGRGNPKLMVQLTICMVNLLGSIYDRIHDAGLSLLRFILSQDEQLMGEETVWMALFGKLKLLSALKSHEPGSLDPPEFKLLSSRDLLTDGGYARRVFEDALAFFRSVCSAAARLSPDNWYEWVMEMIKGLNDPGSGADLDFLLDDLMRSLLLDKQQPRRQTEGASLDATRQLAHHLDWAIEKCGLNDEDLVDELLDTDLLRRAIEASLKGPKECKMLTDCWSSVIRRHPELLYPIIAELGHILSTCAVRPTKAGNVFMQKIAMGPSSDTNIDPAPSRPLCLVNLISFLSVQLGRQTFSDPKSVGLFSLIAEVLLDVGRCWPLGHGRRLVIAAISEYSLRVFLQVHRHSPFDSPRVFKFKTRLFLFLQRHYEQPIDWQIESRRVLQLEADCLKSSISLMRKSDSIEGMRRERRHLEVGELFVCLFKHDLLRVNTLLSRKSLGEELVPKDVKRLLQTASSISVSLCIQVNARLGRQENGTLKTELNKILVKNAWLFYSLDNTPAVVEAVLSCALDPGDLQLGKAVFPPGLLQFLPPSPPLLALALFRSDIYDQSPRWLNYAMRSLESFPEDTLFFYTPQITQAVRRDHLGYIEATILHIARTSSKLAHQIVWNMHANMYIDDLGEVPDPMKGKLEELVGKIVNGLSDVAFYRREFAFFERVTGISGKLKAFIKREKWEKKKRIDEELRQIPVDAGVYLPSNPESTVIDIDYDSGRPLQSQAKAPFMATFRVRDSESNREHWQSAIFKVGDDCRQDVLALQFIAAVKSVFSASGITGYLFPYRVVATAPGCGVIEVIPNSQSRDQLGREKINSLYGYFSFKFGGDRTDKFGAARRCLVKSMAAYSVVCYLLAIRDRHNGNIMVSESGHLIHIDFGFILDIAPGGIRFESAPFKFTSEMLQVLGGRENAAFAWFQELCVQCFLAVRPYCGDLVRLVEQMSESGLPCFMGNPEKAIRNLRWRFRLDADEAEARAYMEQLVYQSCENTSTVLYDSYQHNRNGIPY